MDIVTFNCFVPLQTNLTWSVDKAQRRHRHGSPSLSCPIPTEKSEKALMTSQCSIAFTSAEVSTQKNALSGKTSVTSLSELGSCAKTHRRLFSIASSVVLHRGRHRDPTSVWTSREKLHVNVVKNAGCPTRILFCTTIPTTQACTGRCGVAVQHMLGLVHGLPRTSWEV